MFTKGGISFTTKKLSAPQAVAQFIQNRTVHI